jgi:hypothetical protein
MQSALVQNPIVKLWVIQLGGKVTLTGFKVFDFLQVLLPTFFSERYNLRLIDS